MKHIVLVGMMGAGKSAAGQWLARNLGRQLFDTDAIIEAEQHATINDIFDSKGEAAFRRMEMETLAWVLGEKPGVVATGGGTFAQELARTLIKAKAVSFYLHCSPEILLARLAATTDRPLLTGGDMLETIHALLLTREPLYLQADYTINTGETDIEDVCQKILSHRESFE